MSVSSSVETAKDNSAHLKMSLCEKLKRSQDYFGNCDIDLTSGTFLNYAKPLHTLDFLIIFHPNMNFVCVCRGGGSMIECLNLYKR